VAVCGALAGAVEVAGAADVAGVAWGIAEEGLFGDGVGAVGVEVDASAGLSRGLAVGSADEVLHGAHEALVPGHVLLQVLDGQGVASVLDDGEVLDGVAERRRVRVALAVEVTRVPRDFRARRRPAAVVRVRRSARRRPRRRRLRGDPAERLAEVVPGTLHAARIPRHLRPLLRHLGRRRRRKVRRTRFSHARLVGRVPSFFF